LTTSAGEKGFRPSPPFCCAFPPARCSCLPVGDGRPGDTQRRLYDLARRQLARNIELLGPCAGFFEIAEKSFRLPDSCLPNRYADIAHGCGLGVEYPLIWYPEDAEWGAYNGISRPA
jgi:Xaa-Pro dipeptidase